MEAFYYNRQPRNKNCLGKNGKLFPPQTASDGGLGHRFARTRGRGDASGQGGKGSLQKST